jgi:hypothetical protein
MCLQYVSDGRKKPGIRHPYQIHLGLSRVFDCEREGFFKPGLWLREGEESLVRFSSFASICNGKEDFEGFASS